MENINWFITSEVVDNELHTILVIVSAKQTGKSSCEFPAKKYKLDSFMQKFEFANIEELIDFLNKHKRRKYEKNKK